MDRRITEIASEYKGSLESWALPAVLVLIGLSAFGLGRLSVIGEAPARLLIQLPDGTTQTAAAYRAPEPAPEAAAATAGAYVASKSGEKYYPVGCTAAGRIKEENRVYFATLQDAEAAGYEPAANC